MSRAVLAGLVSLGVCVLLGCAGGVTATKSAKEDPSDFYTFCTREVVNGEFDSKYSTPRPGDGVKSADTDEQYKVEHVFTYTSTSEEANRMMRKLFVRLRREAENEHQYKIGMSESKGSEEAEGVFDHFWF